MKSTTVSTGKKSSSSTTVQDSTIMKITCEYTDPVVAMEMSQAVAEAFTIEMENILGTDAVKLLDKPYAYKVSFDATQHQWMIRIAAFLGGLLIGAAVVVIGEIFGFQNTDNQRMHHERGFTDHWCDSKIQRLMR